MSEIRKHYFLSEYCIIAEERAKRPSDFANAAEDSGKNSPASCSFCGGAEESTPWLLQYIKMGKSLPIPLKKGYETGTSAAFQTSILLFLLSCIHLGIRKLAWRLNLDMVFMKLSWNHLCMGEG
ncbi:MAG: hypothetical protein ACYDEF_04075 [Methanosarcina sp.]